jgi:hypothetical protein
MYTCLDYGKQGLREDTRPDIYFALKQAFPFEEVVLHFESDRE